MITKTADYTIFNKSLFNREIQEKNVTKIMRSLRRKNLLKNRPILVDKDLNVIDGQHRLEAAKRLNMPVWYEVQEDITPEDIILLNDNQRLWDNNAYLNFYVEKGNEHYIRLKSFILENGISLSTAFAVLGLKIGNGGNYMRKDGAGDEPNPFKGGRFIFPEAADQIEAVHILKKSKEIIDYIKPKVEGNHRYLEGPHMRRALYIFLSIKAVDFDVFMGKLAQRLDLVRPCSRISEFVNVFKQIYNFKNRNPITLEEVV